MPGHQKSSSVSSLSFPLPPTILAVSDASSSVGSRGGSHSRSGSFDSICSSSSFATTISELSLSDADAQLADYGVHMSEPEIVLPSSVAPPRLVLNDRESICVDDGPFPPTPREHSNVQYAARRRVDDPLRTACRSFVSGEPIRLAAAPPPKSPVHRRSGAYVAQDGSSTPHRATVGQAKRETLRFSVAMPQPAPRSPRASALSSVLASATARAHPAHPDAALLAEARRLLAATRAISGLGAIEEHRAVEPMPLSQRLARKRSWWSPRA